MTELVLWSTKAIGWSTNNLFLMCEGVVSQSHYSHMRVYIECQETLYVGMVWTRNIVTVKTTLDSLISLQTEGLSVWLQVNLLTLKVANLHCLHAVFEYIQIQWNKTWKCHHMRLFHVALGRQKVGTKKALLNEQSWDPSVASNSYLWSVNICKAAPCIYFGALGTDQHNPKYI